MHGTYSRSKLALYIADALTKGVNETQLSREVAAYLIDQNKTSDLNSILRDVQELRAEKYGVVEVTATTTSPLDTSRLRDVETVAKQQYPHTKRVTVHQAIDPLTVGGINLTFPHTNLDLTIRAKLNQLREAIS